MTRAFLALGANMGDSRGYLRRAVDAIPDLVAVSDLYETDPVGVEDQAAFLNLVVELDTDRSPRQLLELCRELEVAAGRVRRERWGPRTLDCDLLLYGDAAVDEPGLRVPHPRLTERRFVLEPLVEIRPGAALPDGRPLGGFLAAVAGQEVRVHAGPSWAGPV